MTPMPFDGEVSEDHIPKHDLLYFVYAELAGDDPSAISAVLREHIDFLARLDEEERLVFAGPLLTVDGHNSGTGIYALRASSLAEAEAIAEADPMRKANIRTATVSAWSRRLEWPRQSPTADT